MKLPPVPVAVLKKAPTPMLHADRRPSHVISVAGQSISLKTEAVTNMERGSLSLLSRADETRKHWVSMRFCSCLLVWYRTQPQRLPGARIES